ncbi:unnamed protein product [Cuscuta epithymum]|uniref:phosphopyruvate hydratase n=1 Tax=Cuscuta epithymum TaxID=186058 RepID=A0AAV0FHP1_9ASTE|nr:unnamed protein product [Cuscuta epithymum]
MVELYNELCTEYPIVSIEDPFDKEDWEHIKNFSGLGICQVVGDDLLMSNPKRIERAIQENTCNALLLKIKAGAPCRGERLAKYNQDRERESIFIVYILKTYKHQ